MNFLVEDFGLKNISFLCYLSAMSVIVKDSFHIFSKNFTSNDNYQTSFVATLQTLSDKVVFWWRTSSEYKFATAKVESDFWWRKNEQKSEFKHKLKLEWDADAKLFYICSTPFSLLIQNAFSSAWAVAPRTARVTFTGKYIFLFFIEKFKLFQIDKTLIWESQKNIRA